VSDDHGAGGGTEIFVRVYRDPSAGWPPLRRAAAVRADAAAETEFCIRAELSLLPAPRRAAAVSDAAAVAAAIRAPVPALSCRCQ